MPVSSCITFTRHLTFVELLVVRRIFIVGVISIETIDLFLILQN